MATPLTTADILDRSPGHARILGPPRSGKTSLIVERFHALVRTGHHPLVIAFGREQSERLLARLWPDGTAVFGPTPVTTHGLLAARILSAARPSRARTLRDVDEGVVLDRVLLAQPDLLKSDLRSIAASSTLRDALLDVLHRLAQNGLGVEEAEAAETRTDDPRARDILRLFAAYDRHLHRRGLVTFYNAAWEAARVVVADRSLPAAAGMRDVVLVDDFQDLDAGQFALLRAVAPPDGDIALEVFGDPTGSRFSFRGTSERFLMEEFPAVYEAAEFRLDAPVPADPALAASIEMLALERVAMDKAPVGAERREARRDGRSQAPRGRHAMESLPLFAGAPAEDEPAGMEWDVRVRAVRACDEVAEVQHAARQVGEWIEAGIEPGEIGVVSRDPERIASLVHHVFRERGVTIDVGPRSDSAAHAFVHALVGALGRDTDGQFAGALETSPLVRAFCASRELPGDTARAVAVLRKQYATRDSFDLGRLLHESAFSLAPPDLIERVSAEWSRYAEVVAHTGGSPSLDEFRRNYLDVAPAHTEDGRVPRLVSARAVSGHTVRAAVIVGCADGIFPRVDVEGGFLPLGVLADALARVSPGAARDLVARTDRDRAEREEAALLHSALLCAREELCVSHPRKSGDQQRTIPAALSPLFANALDVDRDQAVGFRASALVARAPSDARLARAARAVDTVAGGWLAPALAPRRPTFPELALSPSRLETFTDCERKFFYDRILHIEAPKSIYMTIGNVFHGVLKELLQPDMDGDAVRAALASDAAEDIIERVIAHEMPEAGDWLQDLTRVHMRLMLAGVRELEATREGNYRVLSVEADARLEDDGVAILTGRVDRVDHVEGVGPAVIDYKTSAKMPKTAAGILERIENERDYWQVVVYAALARSLGYDASAFVYYVVPPGEEVNAVGLQLAAGSLPDVIPGGGRWSRYEPMPPALLHDVLDHAMAIHRDILTGECAYVRTDNRKQCGMCHFIRVCRRTAE